MGQFVVTNLVGRLLLRSADEENEEEILISSIKHDTNVRLCHHE